MPVSGRMFPSSNACTRHERILTRVIYSQSRARVTSGHIWSEPYGCLGCKIPRPGVEILDLQSSDWISVSDPRSISQMGIACINRVVRWINNPRSYKYHDVAHRYSSGGYPTGHFLDDQDCLSLQSVRKYRFEYLCG